MCSLSLFIVLLVVSGMGIDVVCGMFLRLCDNLVCRKLSVVWCVLLWLLGSVSVLIVNIVLLMCVVCICIGIDVLLSVIGCCLMVGFVGRLIV